MEIQSKNVKSRSYREKLIDIDLQTIAEAVENIAPSPSSYKVYTALLTQTGGTAPTSIVLENTIGSITFNRISPGFYEVLSNNLFVLGQMYLFLGNGNGGISQITENTTSSIHMVTRDITSDTPFIPAVDDLLENTTIEIRVYNSISNKDAAIKSN